MADYWMSSKHGNLADKRESLKLVATGSLSSKCPPQPWGG